MDSATVVEPSGPAGFDERVGVWEECVGMEGSVV
jgi:hypothetical protein